MDRKDVFKLAKLLRMGELPEAYIYISEREKTPKRPFKEKGRTLSAAAGCYSSLRMQFMKYNLHTISSNGVKQRLPSDFDIMPIPEDLKDYCVDDPSKD